MNHLVSPRDLSRRRALMQALLVGAFSALTLGATTAVHAQAAWPDRPIKLIVPFAAGSGSDTVARVYADKLTEALGQVVMVDNRVGAGGNIAAELAARSAPDGYTLFLATLSTHATNPGLYKKLPYDPLKSFDPVSLVGTFPLILVINPTVPATNIQELVAYARANPGKLTFGSGTGAAQINGELFKSLTKTDMLMVPYKSNPLALTAVMTNEISMMVIDPGPSLPQINAGKVRALAVTSPKRSSLTPNVPTTNESGLPGYELFAWQAIVAPAGTPKPIVARLQAAIARTALMSDVKQRLAIAGIEAQSSTPDELQKFMEAELVKWTTHIRNTGIQPE